MYDNANGKKVKRREILKEGEKDMYLTVVLKSKTLKTEIDFSNKKECYEFAEGLMEKGKKMEKKKQKNTIYVTNFQQTLSIFHNRCNQAFKRSPHFLDPNPPSHSTQPTRQFTAKGLKSRDGQLHDPFNKNQVASFLMKCVIDSG